MVNGGFGRVGIASLLTSFALVSREAAIELN